MPGLLFVLSRYHSVVQKYILRVCFDYSFYSQTLSRLAVVVKNITAVSWRSQVILMRVPISYSWRSACCIALSLHLL